MTRDQQIAYIRKECHRASLASVDREIRLVDVLITLGRKFQNGRSISVYLDGEFSDDHGAAWDLHNNALDLQSDRCIEFIYNKLLEPMPYKADD